MNHSIPLQSRQVTHCRRIPGWLPVTREPSRRPPMRRRFARAGCLAVAWLVLAASLSQAQTLKAPSPNLKLGEGSSAQPTIHLQQVPYPRRIQQSQPVLYWSFQRRGDAVLTRHAYEWPFRVSGNVKLPVPGPRPEVYPDFDPANQAIEIGKQGSLRVEDPGDGSPLDFTRGDSITLEAWVKPDSLGKGQYAYILGKGRTHNPGMPRDNQNYALRLFGAGDSAAVSFLFRSADAPGHSSAYHRWTSDETFAIDQRWHHVALCFTFGEADSLVALIDGKQVRGKWDMGGATSAAPVVDDDELWVGSGLGESPSSTFHGRLDEVAIYRDRLRVDELRERFHALQPPLAVDIEKLRTELPSDRIVGSLVEGVGDRNWAAVDRAEGAEPFELSQLAMFGLPHRYDIHGTRVDRANPLVVRLALKRYLPAGRYEFLLRSRNAARLRINEQFVVENDFMKRNASGHEPVPPPHVAVDSRLYVLSRADQEQTAMLELPAGEHVFVVEAFAGGKGLRDELGELCVGWRWRGGSEVATAPFVALTPEGVDASGLTPQDWDRLESRFQRWLESTDAANRQQAAAETQAYWERRHEWARQQVPPVRVVQRAAESDDDKLNDDKLNDDGLKNSVDVLIARKLRERGALLAEPIDDMRFLRRVTLDLAGIPPSREQLQQYLALPAATRRSQWVDHLLEQDDWAHAWVGYWQDVLAENPGILKPELNNTGPFRWWLYESFLDNKPLDRFATELIMMTGSPLGGGTAGFGMATQNDVPMAAKAHIVSQAFLGMEMKCARCHDAPYRDFKQRDLFELAAMLQRKPIQLPASSSVPQDSQERLSLVQVTLEPGSEVRPEFPFADSRLDPQVAASWLRGTDSRERLALTITSPLQPRFAQVMANRVWKRYLGWGLVEPVDDWDHAEASHPELLDYLANVLIRSGYDLKVLTREVVGSYTYQQSVTASASNFQAAEDRVFAGQAARRLAAEQVVDSLFAVAGKSFRCESLTLDPEGRRPKSTFLNLGKPRRAWQMTALSNERDRPALALPRAQAILDLLIAFGWRDSRPHPVTVRPDEPTVLQPLTLANGVLGNRIARLSDDHRLTASCCSKQDLDALINEIYLTILTREPSEPERELARALLEPGYDSRVVANAELRMPAPVRPSGVSWSNHLHPEATRIKQRIEREVSAGDPPTQRLVSDWRQRCEDLIWTLVNLPEFVFTP